MAKRTKLKTRRPASPRAAGPRWPLAAAAVRLLRVGLLPVAPAAAATAAILAHGLCADARIIAPALAATGIYVFATALNDLMDRRGDAAGGGSPGRRNPLLAPEAPQHAAAAATLATILALGGLALALATALVAPEANATATLTALAAAGGYSLGLKRWSALGPLLLGITAGATTAVGLVGPGGRQWAALPLITGYVVVFVMAFAWAWERRRPPLWGRNWMILLSLCALGLPAADALLQRTALRYAPDTVALRNALLCAALLVPVALVVFFRSPTVRRGTALRFVGLLWLIPLWMAFLQLAGGGNLVFVPALAAVASVVLIRLGAALCRPAATRA